VNICTWYLICVDLCIPFLLSSVFKAFLAIHDAPPRFVMDSTTSPKVMITEREGVKVVLELQDGTRKIDKQVNYLHRLAQTKQQVG
jgi:hypothetical protein